LDGHAYSPTILHRILHLASVTSAFEVAQTALKVVGEILISARQINNLVNEVGQEMAADRDAKTAQYVNASLPRQPTTVDVQPDLVSWQPQTLFHTCVSSLTSSEEFGPMMAAEADRRGLFTAKKKAFVGDGQGYNWTIQQRWFRDFVPIADFVHAVEYVYTAAKTVHADAPSRWRQYLEWATACWKGEVAKVIADLGVWQSRIGILPEGEKLPESDPRKIIHSVTTYLGNSSGRMDYPRYRRQGLPVTSSLAESLVKQISKRVKGTEKFWNDGPSGEAILQLRAAAISDGDRLQHWITNRPISPFSPRCRPSSLANSS
jgi:hypothetical protein